MPPTHSRSLVSSMFQVYLYCWQHIHSVWFNESYGRNSDFHSMDYQELISHTQHWYSFSSFFIKMILNWFSLLSAEPPGRIPTLTIAQRGDTWISVSWQAPGNLGNPPISNYQVSLTSMGNISRETKVVTVNATAGDARISHLLPGVSYTVSVLSLTTLTSSVEEGEANTTMVDTLPPQGAATGSYTDKGKRY